MQPTMQLTSQNPLTMPRRSLLAMLPALLSACSALDVLNATVATDTYRASLGLPYGPDPRQKLDVYQPSPPPSPPPSQSPAAGKAPMVVFFYGGSWSSGNRADYRFVGEALASQGIVAVVADYRLSPAARYPAFVRDSAAAVRWAFDHAGDYGADASRVFVMGHSAGAYNAAMLALDPRWLGAVGLTPEQLAGWIGIAGPYDFLPIGDAKTQVAFNWPDTPADSQPLAQAKKAMDAPRPALLLAPIGDTVVNPQRSTAALAQTLKAQGGRVKLALLEGVSHTTIIASMASVLRSRAPVLEQITGFVGSPS